MSDVAFRLETEQVGSQLTVRAAGELDLATTGQLRAALADARAKSVETVTLDLRQLTFIDSSGLAAVLEFHNGCGQRGIDLTVVRGPEQVDSVFRITGVDERVRLVDEPPPKEPIDERGTDA
jgi:anti-sigma B factor antagonist